MLTFGSLVKIIFGMYTGCNGMITGKLPVGYSVDLYCKDSYEQSYYFKDIIMRPEQLKTIKKEEWETK